MSRALWAHFGVSQTLGVGKCHILCAIVVHGFMEEVEVEVMA